jgi:5-methylcytosine-specific restriction protein B
MKVSSWDDLCQTFRDNLLPLFQEYFYNDWEKIALVLGDSASFNKTDTEKFILKNKVDSDKLFCGDHSDESLDIYSINQNLLDQNFSQLSEQFFIKGFPG